MSEFEAVAADQGESVSKLFIEEIVDYLPSWEFEEVEFLVSHVAARLDLWESTQNPFFMERAFEMSVGHLPITATLQVEMVRAIELRRRGCKGTWGQVTRWEWKSRGFLIMCHLIYHKASLSDAASIVQRWIDRRSEGAVCLKASTLQKDYVDEWRRPGVERDMHDHWANVKTQKDWADWAKFYASADRAYPALEGARR